MHNPILSISALILRISIKRIMSHQSHAQRVERFGIKRICPIIHFAVIVHAVVVGVEVARAAAGLVAHVGAGVVGVFEGGVGCVDSR